MKMETKREVFERYKKEYFAARTLKKGGGKAHKHPRYYRAGDGDATEVNSAKIAAVASRKSK